MSRSECEVIELFPLRRRRASRLGRWGLAAAVLVLVTALLAGTARRVQVLDSSGPAAVSLLPD